MLMDDDVMMMFMFVMMLGACCDEQGGQARILILSSKQYMLINIFKFNLKSKPRSAYAWHFFVKEHKEHTGNPENFPSSKKNIKMTAMTHMFIILGLFLAHSW